MIADLGYAAIVIALLVSAYSIFASLYGAQSGNAAWIASGRNAMRIVFPLTLLSSALLVFLLLNDDFSIKYVASVSSRGMPTYLKVTALWGGQAGSLLFWNLLLAAFNAASMSRNWNRERKLIPYVIAVGAMTQIFFLLLVVFIENPFARLGVVPSDGNGLSPLLRHPGMIIHPPTLYLGFVGFTVPFTFAMAALIANETGDRWIKLTRRWTLVSWLFLSLGLILGGRWAYDVLGWGGYWAWDPVENASFMPWLAGTAFLHSSVIQEKRKMFKAWNIFLIILTYNLVIYGTFIVRSGVISSVHSFAQSAIGPMFFVFIAVMFIFSTYWATKRRKVLASVNRLDSLLSRETAFLLNNFLILGILAATFIGTNFPIVSELFVDEKITVGAPFYEKVNGPLFGLLILLMGVAPLTMWYRTSAKHLGKRMLWPFILTVAGLVILVVSGVTNWVALAGFGVTLFSIILTLIEFWIGTRARMRSKGESVFNAFATLLSRNRRRYGGYIIHVGVLIMAFGIISTELFQQETQVRLGKGQSVALGDYSLTFEGVERYPGADDLIITKATTSIKRNGRDVGTLSPRTELYTRSQTPMTIPAIRSTVAEDFYVLLVNWEGTSDSAATFRIYVNPLINWVWTGGLIFVVGTLVAAWPPRKKVKAVAPEMSAEAALSPAAGN